MPASVPQSSPTQPALAVATFGGGCFWCLDAVFRRVDGVTEVVSGYAGGHVPHPTYEQVCGRRTGHAEVVQVTFDPAVVSYDDLLDVFFGTHDPTTRDRQGGDAGPQYRSSIFPHDPGQRAAAESKIGELEREHVFAAPVVTTVEPPARFWPAEAYHQDYYARHRLQPYCVFVVGPKVAKLRKRFAARLKPAA